MFACHVARNKRRQTHSLPATLHKIVSFLNAHFFLFSPAPSFSSTRHPLSEGLLIRLPQGRVLLLLVVRVMTEVYHLERHVWAWIVGGVFAALACVLSAHTIVQTWRLNSIPNIRRCIIRILLMVCLCETRISSNAHSLSSHGTVSGIRHRGVARFSPQRGKLFV